MTNQTEHHAEAILRADVPVAWMYSNADDLMPCVSVDRWREPEEAGYTETPLYPASAILDAVREAMAQEWLPIESAPKGEYILLCGYLDGPHDPRIKLGYWCLERMQWSIDGASWKPEFWRSLPTPPQDTPQ